MSKTPSRPGLSNKSEAELRAIHLEEVGSEAAPELDTREKLTEAIKAHRDANPVGTEETAAPAAKGREALVSKRHKETGLVQELPQATWDLIGKEVEQYESVVSKPSDLK
ncbi:hypothetical protein F0P96_10535 [Hymenobacter busanensis]|uniref:Uncharacterized protein n=1 Tax=Hymenobacter busanensis TaxID=2607656 RepID=A0A7L4ZYB1_9BACT|nr:hypothetical protein [Hymenobacter busanensis]KAA9333397.1 hypothetical protein F0P96_10535 [Hymenobacter busanensis]QHJ07923.1 hypothetical protein GUY19_11770 [Hymenobacter busanensis]